ncbi:MAG: retropepsin-like aspartic protease [Acidobacteriaceae bacterium]
MAASLRFAWAMSFAAALMAGAQIHPPVYPPALPPVDMRAAQPLVSLPFVYFKQHIYVKATVDGRPEMDFLLDSGSSQSGLNLHTAEALQIKPRSVKDLMDLGLGEGRTFVASAVPVDLLLGTLQVRQKMLVVDMDGLENFSGHRIDGILGFPFFEKYVVKLDFKKDRMDIYPAYGYRYQGPGYAVPILVRDHVPLVDARLYFSKKGKLDAKVEVDTGSDATLLLYRQYEKKHRLEGILPTQGLEKAYGIGGAYTVGCASMDSVQVGVLKADRVRVGFSTATHGVSARSGIDGELGNAFFQRAGGMVFDLPEGQIIFELKRPSSQ